MAEDLSKFIERATDVLAKFAEREKAGLPKPEEAAKMLLESEKNLQAIESRFNVNRLEIMYQYLKMKYPDAAISDTAEKLIKILKVLSEKEDRESAAKTHLIHEQLILELKKIEDKVLAQFPDYQRKF
ncbi:MAG: hypothetical protein PHF84_02130 [bacterium]|nr:hypothetical protein [bacterium]